jgi:hypothetical protein
VPIHITRAAGLLHENRRTALLRTTEYRMSAMPSGTLGCPDAERQHRLAVQLADMIPGATTIRVSLDDPKQTWPHVHALVKDEAGKTMELSRTTTWVAARWILRVWPEADWTRPHTFDLTDVTLTRSDLMAAGRGR